VIVLVVGWSAGRLVGWSAGRLVGWSAGRLPLLLVLELFVRFEARSVHCFVGGGWLKSMGFFFSSSCCYFLLDNRLLSALGLLPHGQDHHAGRF